MGIIAVAGVVALGIIADRYAAVFQRHEASQERTRNTGISPEPLRQIDALIAVENALARAVQEGATSAALETVRAQALAGAEIDEPDYQRVRELCRQWKAGASTPRAYLLAFERRRIELQALDLD